jgi:dTDP-4-amino-4,6-dideoxygalactose transaminase
MNIPFFAFKRKYAPGSADREQVKKIVDEVLDRGIFIMGPEVKRFEECFADYIGAKHAVGLNSGTDAIYLALRAIGVKPGDEVITVSHTATPTVSAIRLTGALPVFVDVDPHTLCMDPALIEDAITSKTRAIVPVHIYGHPCDMNAIMDIAVAHHLPVIEDACQAHGAAVGGKKVGTIGTIGCFSFYPTKNLGALGDGGAIVTNDPTLAEKVRELRNYGEATKFHNVIEGTNSRLDEIQAAVLNWALDSLDKNNQSRQRLADLYIKELGTAPLTLPPLSRGTSERVWHLFVIQVEAEQRDTLKAHLAEKGIETMIHYPTPVFKQPAYGFLDYTADDLPVTTTASQKILSLPLYPELTTEEVRAITKEIKSFLSK